MPPKLRFSERLKARAKTKTTTGPKPKTRAKSKAESKTKAKVYTPADEKFYPFYKPVFLWQSPGHYKSASVFTSINDVIAAQKRVYKESLQDVWRGEGKAEADTHTLVNYFNDDYLSVNLVDSRQPIYAYIPTGGGNFRGSMRNALPTDPTPFIYEDIPSKGLQVDLTYSEN